MSNDTFFAPAERLQDEEVWRGYEVLTSTASILELINAMPEVAGIISPQRQFLLANRRLLDMLGISEISEVLGERPGEAIDCVHSDEHESGCGCSVSCRYCGAVGAILESQRTGARATSECRITVNADNEESSLDLRVTATPFVMKGQSYTILAINDISDEKRRIALERVFFHDVMNTVTIIDVLVDYLRECDDEDALREELGNLDRLCARLIDEISAQRDITAAENGELALMLERLDVLSLLEEVAVDLARHRVAEGKSMKIDAGSPRVIITSDARLIRRVIGNMLKNALEASAKGADVYAGLKGGNDRVEIWVHNQAPMTEEVQRQVFKRSFSTKGADRGLGTYSMKLLGERYLRGRISFESSEDDGTTFTAAFHSIQ